MIKNRLAKTVFGSAFLTTMMVPAIAFAEEVPRDPSVDIAMYAAAGASLCIAAMATAFAQSKIGAAGAGTLAERPEAGTTLIVLQALPETIILLGFVIAFMMTA
ncbi:MAG: hypothetical protein WBJ62_06485 [Coriobacteriia bacterium]|jgi:V/A-type H+-transporting ATPase subunit K